MTIAPPEVLPSSDVGGDDPGEALIKEAKRRARRRRFGYGGAAATVVAVAVVAGFAIVPNHPAPPTRPAPDPPLGAPLVEGPDPASTLLTSWGQFHVGYVYVYGDGRVIWFPDRGVFVAADGRVTGILETVQDDLSDPATAQLLLLTESGLTPAPSHYGKRRLSLLKPTRGLIAGELTYAAIERRLSPRGLDLVRAGTLEPEHFLEPASALGPLSPSPQEVRHIPYSRQELWAEPTARRYEPFAYALCGPFRNGEPVSATETLGQLPAPAQALLDGKQRTYDLNIGTANWPAAEGPFPPWPSMECFEVTPAELAALPPIFLADGTTLLGIPLNPHGQPMLWGG